MYFEANLKFILYISLFILLCFKFYNIIQNIFDDDDDDLYTEESINTYFKKKFYNDEIKYKQYTEKYLIIDIQKSDIISLEDFANLCNNYDPLNDGPVILDNVTNDQQDWIYKNMLHKIDLDYIYNESKSFIVFKPKFKSI